MDINHTILDGHISQLNSKLAKKDWEELTNVANLVRHVKPYMLLSRILWNLWVITIFNAFGVLDSEHVVTILLNTKESKNRRGCYRYRKAGASALSSIIFHGPGILALVNYSMSGDKKKIKDLSGRLELMAVCAKYEVQISQVSFYFREFLQNKNIPFLRFAPVLELTRNQNILALVSPPATNYEQEMPFVTTEETVPQQGKIQFTNLPLYSEIVELPGNEGNLRVQVATAEATADALVMPIDRLLYENIEIHYYNLYHQRFLPRRSLFKYNTFNTSVNLESLEEKYSFVKFGKLKLAAWYLGMKTDAGVYERQEAKEMDKAFNSPPNNELLAAVLVSDLHTLQYLMLHDFQRWETMVNNMYNINPGVLPLELRVKYCSIPIFANASRQRDKMFPQVNTLADAEWKSAVIDSVGCSPELLGIIGKINSLSQSLDLKEGNILWGKLLSIRQLLPSRESELCGGKRQMAIHTATAIEHGTILYLLCRGMRFQPDHEAVRACVSSVLESLGHLTTGGPLFSAMYPLWVIEVLGVVLSHPIYVQFRGELRRRAVNDLRLNSHNSNILPVIVEIEHVWALNLTEHPDWFEYVLSHFRNSLSLT